MPACSAGAPATLSPSHATELLLATLQGGAYEVTVIAIDRPEFLSDRSDVRFDWTFHSPDTGRAIVPAMSRAGSFTNGRGRAEFRRGRAGWIVKSMRLGGDRPAS